MREKGEGRNGILQYGKWRKGKVMAKGNGEWPKWSKGMGMTAHEGQILPVQKGDEEKKGSGAGI